MTALSAGRVTRWAAGDGGLAAPGGSLDEAAALEALPKLGVHVVEVGGEAYEVERVGSRYCSVADMRAYAAANNDAFADASAYPDDEVLAAIQAAEEAIEDACGRSFCTRARTVALAGTGSLEELPEVDARSLSAGTLVGDRQAVADAPAEATLVYGARGSERCRQACMRLAATYLRPRSGAENARGTSVDGVYVSYELATGAEGSWTGIPYVDSFIESARSRRVVVM